MSTRPIKTALISVFDKEGIDKIVKKLSENDIKILSTGGTKKYIESLGIQVEAVEDLTGYPSILDGRVKTLHPKIFGGILTMRDNQNHAEQISQREIPEIDLVVVDLYPFEKTVAQTKNEAEIIEKIDIGGISLIRAAAKNYKDVVVIPAKQYYDELEEIVFTNNCLTTLEQRRSLAKAAFSISSHYDTAIYNHFKENEMESFRYSENNFMELRYGENPHQNGRFFGDFDEIFDQIHGKKISYNNLLDITAAVDLIAEFDELTVAILKHTNACGVASRKTLVEAWKAALAGDPLSAFGGIVIANTKIDKKAASEIDKIFFEVIIAPEYDDEALEVLKKKKNRIILVQKGKVEPKLQFRTVLNGVLAQQKDTKIVSKEDFDFVTEERPTNAQIDDLIFANKIVKNSKSNTIVLAKNKQLVGSGVGETSRIDALKHAIEKAKHFELDLQDAVMSSDAFFPFADSVEAAFNAGIRAVIQPGGSIRDAESIRFCDRNKMSMVFTGIRHFKH